MLRRHDPEPVWIAEFLDGSGSVVVTGDVLWANAIARRCRGLGEMRCCRRCTYTWLQRRVGAVAKACPACQSHLWNRELPAKQKTGPQPKSLADRFWPKVKKLESGCWEWQGALDGHGYGVILKEGGGPPYKRVLAHRVSWLMQKGNPGDLDVLHRCDNPPCVNPDHLFLGTQSDNARDMVSKGRMFHGSGERNGRAKITQRQAKEIRERHKAGESYSALARAYDIGESSVGRIIRKEIWVE
jgi:hypothetical protein